MGEYHRHHSQTETTFRKGLAARMLAITLRVGGLIICPGDDIAAAALAALNHPDKNQSQQSAIMPDPLEIDSIHLRRGLKKYPIK